MPATNGTTTSTDAPAVVTSRRASNRADSHLAAEKTRVRDNQTVFVDLDVPHEAAVERLEPVRALGQPGVALRVGAHCEVREGDVDNDDVRRSADREPSRLIGNVLVNCVMARSTSMAPVYSGIGMPASFLHVPVPSPTPGRGHCAPP